MASRGQPSCLFVGNGNAVANASYKSTCYTNLGCFTSTTDMHEVHRYFHAFRHSDFRALVASTSSYARKMIMHVKSRIRSIA